MPNKSHISHIIPNPILSKKIQQLMSIIPVNPTINPNTSDDACCYGHKQVLAVMPNGWVGALHGTPGKIIEVLLVHCPAMVSGWFLWLVTYGWKLQKGNLIHVHTVWIIWEWIQTILPYSYCHIFMNILLPFILPFILVFTCPGLWSTIYMCKWITVSDPAGHRTVVNHRNLKGDNSDPKCL